MGTQPTESDYGKESEPVGERSTRDSDKRGGEQPGYYREQPGGLEGKEAEKIADIKEKTLSLTENKSEVEPEKEKQNERERTEEQDGRRDNSRAESGRDTSESKQVGGQGTPATDITGHSQSKRGTLRSAAVNLAGFKYDLSKSYSNEEIHQIVSSVTDMILFLPAVDNKFADYQRVIHFD